MTPIHYAIERTPDGQPCALYWSSEIQAAGENRTREIQAKRAAEEAQQKRPAPWIEAWLARKTP